MEEWKYLVWDVTCLDSFVPFHLVSSTSGAGVVAKQAKQKSMKYFILQPKFLVVQVVIKTSRVFGLEAFIFLHELGRCLKIATLILKHI